MNGVRGAFAALGALLALCALPHPAAANPVPADEQSLLNGADYFARYCTECHGWDPAEQYDALYGEDPVDGPDPLLDIVAPVAEADEFPLAEEPEDDWPEWAGPPPEADEAEEDVRSAVLDDMTAAIDAVYDEDLDHWGYELPQDDSYDGGDYGGDGSYAQDYGSGDLGDPYAEDPDFDLELDRVPGATDLAEPDEYIYGTAETDLYTTIANGTGASMPGFMHELGSEEAIWDLVNYIRSLWGEDWAD